MLRAYLAPSAPVWSLTGSTFIGSIVLNFLEGDVYRPVQTHEMAAGVVAGFAGRKKLGATGVMIDFRSGKPKDTRSHHGVEDDPQLHGLAATC